MKPRSLSPCLQYSRGNFIFIAPVLMGSTLSHIVEDRKLTVVYDSESVEYSLSERDYLDLIDAYDNCRYAFQRVLQSSKRS